MTSHRDKISSCDPIDEFTEDNRFRSRATNRSESLSRREALTTALFGLGAVGSSVEKARVLGGEPDSSSFSLGITPEVRLRVALGLRWLTSRQQSDGGFGEPGRYARNVGVCALSGLAWLASHGPHGPFSPQIAQCIRYLQLCAHPDGVIVEREIVTHAPLYGHGFATLFLSQVYGEFDVPSLAGILKRATVAIIQRQNSQGGWHYTTDPDDADVSITTCLLIALIAAHSAGVAVPRMTIERSISFLKRCQNSDGGFRYRLHDPADSIAPRSAAAIVALCVGGRYNDQSVARAYQYFKAQQIPLTPAPDGLSEYFYYGQFYSAHAAWLAGEAEWNRWFPSARDRLLRRQATDGSWHDANIGDEYATAMALLVLLFPLRQTSFFALSFA